MCEKKQKSIFYRIDDVYLLFHAACDNNNKANKEETPSSNGVV
jgi:hypothetical protein